MTTIVVEDGTKVVGANSYVTMAEYIDYAASLNLTVTDTQAFRTQIIKAAQFIGGLESVLKGDTTEKNQPMAYPRNALTDIDGWSYDNNEIPPQVKQAQLSLAVDINSGEDLWNLSQSGATGIKREKVEGAVEVEYAVSDTGRLPYNSRSQALLASLMKFNGLGIPLAMA
tara:strand:+ start:229 stop:738 length:510 start_codon:yes stop_codon:yes gene_type:complete